MRRRLDLAASLVGRPSVLYLDEPTTGLDPVKREDVWGMVRDLAADGVTVLLTTQYLDEADALADEISVIGHGRVIAHGTPAELKQIVGGQSITVRPADPSQVDAVAAILSAVSGRPVTSPGRGVVTVPVASAEPFSDVVRRLADADITASELSLHLPSLDEVFFTLTGRTEVADEPDGAERADDHPGPEETYRDDTKAMANR
jgi:oleandomycin transport system ATP-binding protein